MIGAEKYIESYPEIITLPPEEPHVANIDPILGVI
jgi:hypothetical protein